MPSAMGGDDRCPSRSAHEGECRRLASQIAFRAGSRRPLTLSPLPLARAFAEEPLHQSRAPGGQRDIPLVLDEGVG